MYKKDDKGEYRVSHSWVAAYDSGGSMGHYSYFNLCEIREYADGEKSVWIGPPVYIHEKPMASFAHRIYVNAERELRMLATK